MANPKQQLVELILAYADLTGSHVAIEQGERSISYSELRRLTRERASLLADRGASGAFVALERRRSPEFIVDFLAVLSAGGTVIPLDPDTPPD
ncbi:MAG TPA: AMP-binding protein, partial [Micromonosporaceae bacterium]